MIILLITAVVNAWFNINFSKIHLELLKSFKQLKKGQYLNGFYI